MESSDIETKLYGVMLDWLTSDIQSCFKDMIKSDSFWVEISQKIQGYDEEYILERLYDCRVELRLNNSSKNDYL